MKVNLTLNKTTYSRDEELQIELDLGLSPDLASNLTTINIDISIINVERNRFVWGFGYAPQVVNNKIQIRRKLDENLSEGLYVISGLKFIYGRDGSRQIVLGPEKDIPRTLFWLGSKSDTSIDHVGLNSRFKELLIARNNYINKVIITRQASEPAAPTKNYIVLVFAVGCLVHGTHNLAGYTIYPLRQGYSYEHMLKSINNFLAKKCGITLSFDKGIDEDFGHSTPLFVIEYKNVVALDEIDAARWCADYSDDIFTILSYEKGQRPNQYATVAIEPKTKRLWQWFHFPGYSGNLISSFNPSSTADMIDALLPRIQNSPWLDLILHSFGEATSEKNVNVAYLKHWSVLELIGKRRVRENDIKLTYPNGDAIIDSQGKNATTKNALGKVYRWLMQSEVPALNGSDVIFETYQTARERAMPDNEIEIVKLWDVLKAAYEIRNSTAHEGSFDLAKASQGDERQKLAAYLFNLANNIHFDYTKLITKYAVSQEISLDQAVQRASKQ